MADTATYVYCIVDAPRRPAMSRVPPGLPGAGSPVAESLGGTLWLIAADVPLDTYGSAPLEAALRDLDWVGRVAVAHEAVVEHFTKLKGTTVVPAKLFTMFSSIDRALADTRARRREIAAAVRRIAGCEEWGVRVIRGTPALPKRASVAPDARTGAGFLAAKRQARDEVQKSAAAAAEAALDAFRTLASAAREARKRDDVPENAPAPPLLDAAFLVPAKGRARFRTSARRAAEQCAKAGAELTVSGPWPAYNFIQPEKRS